jgi:ankyrin repeat protein
MAASLGNAALVSALLRAGAEVNLLAPDGSSALMSAAENGSLPIVRALLESGANASVSRNDGLTND